MGQYIKSTDFRFRPPWAHTPALPHTGCGAFDNQPLCSLGFSFLNGSKKPQPCECLNEIIKLCLRSYPKSRASTLEASHKCHSFYCYRDFCAMSKVCWRDHKGLFIYSLWNLLFEYLKSEASISFLRLNVKCKE